MLDTANSLSDRSHGGGGGGCDDDDDGESNLNKIQHNAKSSGKNNANGFECVLSNR